MPPRLHSTLLAALAVLLTFVASARAGDGCCAHCGSCDGCQKVCRLVCDEKKIDVICWGCECEDFCVPGPSHRDCKHCKMLCEECNEAEDCYKPHGGPKKFVWYDWIPSTCAKVFTKKKLMQKKVKTTVPNYKWVVEDLCSKCEARAESAQVEPGAKIPPAPAIADAKLKPVRATAAVPEKSTKQR